MCNLDGSSWPIRTVQKNGGSYFTASVTLPVTLSVLHNSAVNPGLLGILSVGAGLLRAHLALLPSTSTLSNFATSMLECMSDLN